MEFWPATNDITVTSPSHPHRQRRLAMRIETLLIALFTGWVIGQICRDKWWLTGLLFYIPSPVLFLGLLTAALIRGRRRQWRQSVQFIVLSLAPLYFVVAVENSFRGSPVSDGAATLRAVHWNVCSGHLGKSGIIETMHDLNADLYVLSEAPHPFPEIRGYQSQRVGTMQVLSKHAMEPAVDLNPENGRCYQIPWKTPATELTVLVADLPSSIRYHRHPMLNELTQQLADTQADLLLGDLNAPRRSLALADLPEGYQHAYRSSGSGWSYTWPSLLPVFAIDHCIHGERLASIAYALQTSPHSDHRIQVFEFAIHDLHNHSLPDSRRE